MCNKDTERFSIVISTYNRAWSIERAIDSVLNQSYKNWELIIIDDGSTDDTEKILRKKYLENPKIKLFHHKNKENRGVAASQNLAMRNLSGMYYCFLGSDDELSPKALEIAHTYFTKLQDVKCLLFKGQSFSVNEDITSLPFDYAVVSYDDYLVNPLYDFEAFLFQHRELIDNGYFFDEDILRESVRHKRVAKKYKTAFINKTVAIFHKEGNDRVCYNSTPTENYTRIFEGERRFLEENGKRLKQLSSFQYNKRLWKYFLISLLSDISEREKFNCLKLIGLNMKGVIGLLLFIYTTVFGSKGTAILIDILRFTQKKKHG